MTIIFYVFLLASVPTSTLVFNNLTLLSETSVVVTTLVLNFIYNYI